MFNYNRSTSIAVITVKQYLNKYLKKKHHKCFIEKPVTISYDITFILNTNNFKNQFKRSYTVILPQIR